MTKEKTFYFVNGLDADRASKKLMRRHVMKGKNAGKTFHRPSRVALQKARRPSAVDCYHQEARYEYWMPLSAQTGMRSVGNALLSFSLPVEVTPQSLMVINQFFGHVIDRIYPVHPRISPQDMKLMWMRVLSLDADAYTCNMYLMQASNALFLGNGEASPTALHHISQTLAAVNKRLQSNKALSDSTVAIIISLVHQEQMRNREADAKIHFKGLARIVELRGGLGQMLAEGDPLLPTKVCKTDVMFALQYGGPTYFFQDRMPDVRNKLLTKGINFDVNSAATTCSPHSSLGPDLEAALRGAMAVSVLFNNDLHDWAVDGLSFVDIVISLLYRLLRFSSLNEPAPEPAVHATYHIGLIIFVMMMVANSARSQLMKCGLILRRLRAVLNGGLDKCDNELVFWVTFMGGTWIADDVDGDWFASSLRTQAQELGLDSWQAVRRSLCKFPWIHGLHDEPGREFWDQITQGYQTSGL
ncbi:hypothetical protein CONLIGDRAFT_716076 [Coniochaeta ligniaria NRRL 30616]|uniref:Transcription factor domain-containing protein n=1 Tax=Coniochaeta ligniaria NRRL 30616 TaxID=1408157 RepID=A0A1J7IJG6_9PEZI|nr:hypothetical protein CONLIGDRAFT_716076 [Coniochaeta ligniaria NRRL 30616]